MKLRLTTRVLVALAGLMSLGVSAETTIKPGDRIRITRGPAPVKDRARGLTTVEKGTELTAIQVLGDWVKVTVANGGRKVTGWIHSARVTRIPRSVESPGHLERNSGAGGLTSPPATEAELHAALRAANPRYTGKAKVHNNKKGKIWGIDVSGCRVSTLTPEI